MQPNDFYFECRRTGGRKWGPYGIFQQCSRYFADHRVGLGGALCVWGGINLLEGYGQDNPGSKSQGVKQLVAGGGVALIGVTLVPLLSGLLG